LDLEFLVKTGFGGGGFGCCLGGVEEM